MLKKVIINSLLFFVFCVNLEAQNTYFNKIIEPFPGANTLISVVQIDSFYYCFSFKLDTVNPWRGDIVLLKIDLQGNMVDTAVIGMPYRSFNAVQGNSLIKLSDGNLLACGATKDTSELIFAYLLKFDKNLDTLWSGKYAHPDTLAASQPGADVLNYFYAIKETPDKGFIIAANYNIDCIPGEYRSYIMKTDSLGNFEFIKKYDNYYTFYDIEIASDSGFFIPTSLNGQGNLKVLKTDKFGEIEWTSNINTQLYPNYPIDVLLFDSNTVIAVSSHWFDIVYYRRALVVSKIDINQKTKIWEKVYYTWGNLNSYSLTQSISIEKSNDGNIVIGSTATISDNISSSPSRGFLFKLNTNGDSLWMRNYGIGPFEYNCVFHDFIPTSDGGFLGVGYQKSQYTGQRDWIIKLDSLGCDTPGCHTTGFNNYYLNSGKLKIYPNPANDIINLDLNINNFEFAKIEIIDIYGRIALNEYIQENKSTLDISRLNEGVYFIKVLIDGNLYKRKFIKI